MGDIFIPILPAIVTAGLLMGISNILTMKGLFGPEKLIEMYPQIADISDIINVIANTAFIFLPALIGWSSMRVFGGSPILGLVLGESPTCLSIRYRQNEYTNLEYIRLRN